MVSPTIINQPPSNHPLSTTNRYNPLLGSLLNHELTIIQVVYQPSVNHYNPLTMFHDYVALGPYFTNHLTTHLTTGPSRRPGIQTSTPEPRLIPAEEF